MPIAVVGFAVWSCPATTISAEPTSKLRLVQPYPNCSDFDVVPVGWNKPAFRLLLPEQVSAEGPKKIEHGGTHGTVGKWQTTNEGLHGVFRIGEAFEITVDLAGRDKTVDIQMAVRNLTPETLGQVRVLICSPVNHLPGKPDWSNRLFIPQDIPEDRDAQGRYWYQHVAPQRLRALRPQGWIVTHPSPDNPDPDGVPKYNFLVSTTSDTAAYAVQSLDGKWLFYQTWDKPSRYATPCPGNACMHLHPLVAERLEPGATATIRGKAGLFQGDWEGLRKLVKAKE